MSLLQDFLIENSDVATKEYDVIVSNRFKDKDGKVLKFKIKPVSGEEFGEYQKKSTSIEFVGKKRTVQMDSSKFNNMVIINNCIDPDFKNVDLLKKVGAVTPEQALSKLLLAGEIIELAGKISTISGFDSDINEEIETAKN